MLMRADQSGAGYPSGLGDCRLDVERAFPQQLGDAILPRYLAATARLQGDDLNPDHWIDHVPMLSGASSARQRSAWKLTQALRGGSSHHLADR
ncbi:hypothetical protein ACFQZ4_09040 [Catellatospora coxensis]